MSFDTGNKAINLIVVRCEIRVDIKCYELGTGHRSVAITVVFVNYLSTWQKINKGFFEVSNS